MKEDWKYVKITYLTEKERKAIRKGDFRSKLTINQSFSTDKEKKGGDTQGLRKSKIKEGWEKEKIRYIYIWVLLEDTFYEGVF